MNINEPSRRLSRCRLRIAEYDFQIKYEKGADNAHADALSCLLTSAPIEPNDPDGTTGFAMDSLSDFFSKQDCRYPDEGFLEDGNYQLDLNLPLEEDKPRELHF